MPEKKKKIVFFGDSVTEGCFEILRVNGQLELLKDKSSSYGEILAEKLRRNYPEVMFEFINSGNSGDGTKEALARVDKDVLEHHPDIVIFCFELNDISYRDAVGYGERVRRLFDKLKESGCTVIVMSSNMVNKYISPDTLEEYRNMAGDCADCQNSGVLDAYTETLRELSSAYGFFFADAYAEWKRLDGYGIDTTALLCNHLNHPSRRMHRLFADVLFDCMEKNKLILR